MIAPKSPTSLRDRVFGKSILLGEEDRQDAIGLRRIGRNELRHEGLGLPNLQPIAAQHLNEGDASIGI